MPPPNPPPPGSELTIIQHKETTTSPYLNLINNKKTEGKTLAQRIFPHKEMCCNLLSTEWLQHMTNAEMCQNTYLMWFSHMYPSGEVSHLSSSPVPTKRCSHLTTIALKNLTRTSALLVAKTSIHVGLFRKFLAISVQYQEIKRVDMFYVQEEASN